MDLTTGMVCMLGYVWIVPPYHPLLYLPYGCIYGVMGLWLYKGELNTNYVNVFTCTTQEQCGSAQEQCGSAKIVVMLAHRKYKHCY